jgi:hypothetical protein
MAEKQGVLLSQITMRNNQTSFPSLRSTTNNGREMTTVNGSCPILVMSGEAWDTLYISTGEARTANRERPHACTHLPLPPTIDG